MESLVITMGWLGLFAPVALGAIGSGMGCGRAGQAAAGAMLETEGGHARYVGLSALPSSQVIYGIVVMFALRREVTFETAPAMFAIGVLTGVALLVTAVWQGNSCAAAIQASKHKPEIFGISVAPAAIVEGFSVFAFVFALVLTPDIPS